MAKNLKKWHILLTIAVLFICGAVQAKQPQNSQRRNKNIIEEQLAFFPEFRQLPWIVGEGKRVTLCHSVSLILPKGTLALKQDGTKEFERLIGDIGKPLCGIILGNKWDWVAYISEHSIGMIDTADMDFTKMVSAIETMINAENKERIESGIPEIVFSRWHQMPTYDRARKTLTWSAYYDVEGMDGKIFNEETTLLMPTGVVHMVFAADVPPCSKYEYLDFLSDFTKIRNSLIIKQTKRENTRSSHCSLYDLPGYHLNNDCSLN